MTRISLALLMTLTAVFLPIWLVIPLAVAYAVRFWAIELVVFGALIDAYFGAVTAWPYYTLAAIAIVVTAELAKQHLTLFKNV